MPIAAVGRSSKPSFRCAVVVAVLAVAASRLAAAVPAKGRLLVASEDLRDPNFSRTVVLLLDSGDAGALGVVLNRPSRLRLADLMPEREWAQQMTEPIFVGGPVAVTEAMMVFKTEREHEQGMQVLDGVHAGWDLELLERMTAEPREGERVRVFAGYSGWAPGQLEGELERGGWHVLPASESTIFSDRESALWERLIERTRTRIALGSGTSMRE